MEQEHQRHLDALRAAIAHEDPDFAQAIEAVVCAEPEKLAALLQASPELVAAHSKSDHRATLFHYVASNAIEDELQQSPIQIYNVIRDAQGEAREKAAQRAIDTAQVLVDTGADVDAVADAYGGGKSQTPLNWLVSSGHPNVAGVMFEMTDVFCRGGANVNGLENNSTPVITALGFGHPQAVKALVKHGCLVDNVLLAAAAGDVEKLKSFRTENGFSAENVQRCATDWFKPPQGPKQAAELALVFASICGQATAIRFLVDASVDINSTPNGRL